MALCKLALAGSAPVEGTKTGMLFFQLSLILMESASCRVGSGVVDAPLLGGEVLEASLTDGRRRALAADEHRQCPPDNDDLPLPGLEKSRPVKSSTACK